MPLRGAQRPDTGRGKLKIEFGGPASILLPLASETHLDRIRPLTGVDKLYFATTFGSFLHWIASQGLA